jgi:predicted DNA-binding protein (MmcQ/YjbR family)
MTIPLKEIHAYCLGKKGVTQDFPFDEETLVFRVLGKIFALCDNVSPVRQITLKCDPDWALALRDQYTAVQPGYHVNKAHWNTITIDGSIPESEVWQMIDHAYQQVVKGLKKADRERLLALKQDDDLSPETMAHLAARGGAFDWLLEPAEDGIYTDDDGEPV